MTQARQSYPQGRWRRGAGEQRPLPGAATGRWWPHDLQRTAVQGHPDLLATLVPGAEDQS